MRTTILKGLLFLALPLGALELLIAARVLAPAPDLWFTEVEDAACRGKVDAIFAGSSRVAAAIDANAFSRRIAEATRRVVTTVNMSRGYTLLAEHNLALRRLYQRCGPQVRGASVLIEAPAGLPEFSTFDDPWVHSDQPGLIVPLIGRDELIGLWASRTPLADKVFVTARLLPGINYLEATRTRLLTLDERVQRLLASRRRTDAAAAIDLAAAGGVMTDRRGVERARRLAVALAPATFRDDRGVPDWSATVLMDINRIVREHGGRLVVFYMPLSSVQRAPYQTPTRRADAESFRREAAAAGVQYVEPPFTTRDEDFPDYWHLRASRAGEFSRRVAESYLHGAAAATQRALNGPRTTDVQ
jgi:hypothetical protein